MAVIRTKVPHLYLFQLFARLVGSLIACFTIEAPWLSMCFRFAQQSSTLARRHGTDEVKTTQKLPEDCEARLGDVCRTTGRLADYGKTTYARHTIQQVKTLKANTEGKPRTIRRLLRFIAFCFMPELFFSATPFWWWFQGNQA